MLTVSMFGFGGLEALLVNQRVLREAAEISQMVALPLRAARNSAAAIRSTRAEPDEQAAAWQHLAEFASDLRIEPGPPPSISRTTAAADLEGIEPFTLAHVVEAVVGELLSGRLERVERTSPYTALRGNVQREAHRYYVRRLEALRADRAIHLPIDDPDLEAITGARMRCRQPDLIPGIDLATGLKELRKAGLPADVAVLLFERFRNMRRRKGDDRLDAYIAGTLGWSTDRLERAQAALRPERWGGRVQQWFLDGSYVPSGWPAHGRGKKIGKMSGRRAGKLP